MADNDPPLVDQIELGDFIVFMRDGTVDPCVNGEDELHAYACREDYGFALRTGGIPDTVRKICYENEISTPIYGNLVEEAMVRGAICAGQAALMTLDTQAWSDMRRNDAEARKVTGVKKKD